MAIFSFMSMRANQRAARASQEANQLQRQQMALEQARQKREAIRAARSARGRAVNVAANQGVSGSSGAQGGISSIGSQLSYNLSFLDQQEGLADQASAALGRARMHESRAQTWGAMANLTWKAGSAMAGGGG